MSMGELEVRFRYAKYYHEILHRAETSALKARGIADHLSLMTKTEKLTRLARPKGSCAVCDIGAYAVSQDAVWERSDALGLLTATPSEGQHSWHAEYLPAATAAAAA